MGSASPPHLVTTLLQQLLTNYPQSDKIGDAAYQLGDLYEGRAYKQYRRAAQYFERDFQWNPNTRDDSRLRAARLYDRQLMERSRAIELYRDVTTHETDPRRMQEAQKRVVISVRLKESKIRIAKILNTKNEECSSFGFQH